MNHYLLSQPPCWLWHAAEELLHLPDGVDVHLHHEGPLPHRHGVLQASHQQQSGPVRVHCFFLRFVYVRHATGLVKEGTRLLHWLTVVFIAAFSINLMLMWPVRCKQHLEYINIRLYQHPTHTLGTSGEATSTWTRWRGSYAPGAASPPSPTPTRPSWSSRSSPSCCW